jgi:hypothetical protein
VPAGVVTWPSRPNVASGDPSALYRRTCPTDVPEPRSPDRPTTYSLPSRSATVASATNPVPTAFPPPNTGSTVGRTTGMSTVNCALPPVAALAVVSSTWFGWIETV